MTLPDLKTMKHQVFHVFTNVGEFLEPKCDLCGTPESERPRYSDGVGIYACDFCWQRIHKAENPHVVTDQSVAKLVEALEWFIENDDTNRGGEWEHKNAYWIDGLERGIEAVAFAKGEPYVRDENPDGDTITVYP